ncbi:MAG: putative metalloprotease CJM1_0395 family protein [Phycisphaerales bacterium]
MLDPISAMSALTGAVAAASGLAPRLVRVVQPVEHAERVAGSDRRDSVELSSAARLFAAKTEPGTAEQPGGGASVGGQGADVQLTDQERQEVAKLKQRDREVRTHEQAHRAAGGAHAGAISLQFTQGPDGKRYAVEGSVPIDLSPVKGDPAATIRKMQQVQRAALAPADPSGADRRIAAQARRAEQQARAELTAQKRNAAQGTTAITDDEQRTDDNAADQTSQVDLVNPYAAATGALQHLTLARFVDLLA